MILQRRREWPVFSIEHFTIVLYSALLSFAVAKNKEKNEENISRGYFFLK